MADTFRRLMEHLAWADQRALAALQAAGAPDPALVELYAHVLGAEAVWLARIEGRAAPMPVWPRLDLAGCAALAAENAAGLRRYAADLTPAELARPVTYRNSAGAEFTSTVEDILVQVALHGSYHRGQVARGLRQDGHEPQATDYIAWARGAPAAVRRPGA